MRYEELIKQVNKYYYKNEYLYFRTIESLEEVSKDLTKLEDNKHLIGVIKPFLIKWGRMGRVVGREGLNWEEFGEALRSSEEDFANLRNEKFYKIDFDADKIMNSILNIYGEIDPLDYLGSPTTISKTLHVLNPEIFVMWDNGIRQRYKKISKYISYGKPRGYLEFLSETQREIREAMNDRQRSTEKDLEEIEKELRKKFRNITLAKIVDQYNYGLVHPF